MFKVDRVAGGTVILNGSLDYDDTFNIKGGLPIATGSSGMAQAPSDTSSQVSIKATFSSTKSADFILMLLVMSMELYPMK